MSTVSTFRVFLKVHKLNKLNTINHFSSALKISITFRLKLFTVSFFVINK